MASTFETFKALHTAKKLFILPNAWDAESAKIFQESNYPAVGTSSAAVAASLGYDDGENMSFSEYLFVIQRIAASVNIPVTIDIEMGYAKTPEAVYTNIQKLLEAGVAGINIEDSSITKGKRALKSAEDLARTVEFVKNKLGSSRQQLFINVRCDTYLLNVSDAQNETTRRLKIYGAAGADGIFLPCIKEPDDIGRAVSETKLPLNVMVFPGIADVDTLNKLGVKRLSMGPFLHNKTYGNARELAKKVLEQNSIKSIL
ncbi:MAG TPA: isocitrate lyase/phosphoenolpyruvate mutase family protein [Cyclobacteriaceae bacterium]|nr:isocitrate lyase/phosphoenolpyruvate mutase family protein [Cyclobacteriaceae bacterium]